jgi:hypothetical protein
MFLWLNNIPLCEHTTFGLSIHQLMSTWAVSSLVILCSAAMDICVRVFVLTCFQFCWVNTLGVEVLGYKVTL